MSKKKKKLKKLYKNFQEFKKDFEIIEDSVFPEFLKTAKLSGHKFINTAKDITDKEKLVDTGNYKRNWAADVIKAKDGLIVKGLNSVEYASHLEYGHKIKGSNRKLKGKFVGTQAIEEAQNYALKRLKESIYNLFND